MDDFNKSNIRLSHPNLYRSIMTFALMDIGLGMNFLLTNPTFNAYGLDKVVPGVIFFTLGFSKVVFLNFSRNLKIVRILMTAEIIFMIIWGVGTSITFFQGRTSLQLFVLYVGFAVLETFLLIEPIVNPLSEVKKNGSTK